MPSTDTETSTSVLCPLCTSPCSPYGERLWDPVALEYRDPTEPLFRCKKCYFIIDARLPLCVGMKLNGDRTVTITADLSEITSDPLIQLLPWSEVLSRLKAEDPHPLVTTFKLPNPHPEYFNPPLTTNVSNRRSFTITRTPLPFYLGSSPEELRTLCRRLGPIEVPTSFRLNPSSDSTDETVSGWGSHAPTVTNGDLFYLRNPPTGCVRVVTCNPRAVKAKATLSKNKISRALAAVEKHPHPDPSFFSTVLTLFPLSNAHSLAKELSSISARCAARDPRSKNFVSFQKNDRAYAFSSFFSFLGLLLANIRLPPHRISTDSSLFTHPSGHGWSPAPRRAPHRSRDVDRYFSSRSSLAHSPCTRWWRRNTPFIHTLLPVISPYDLTPHLLYSDWWNSLPYPAQSNNHHLRPEKHPDEPLHSATHNPGSIVWIFRRLRFLASLPEPLFTPPVLEVVPPCNPSSVEDQESL